MGTNSEAVGSQVEQIKSEFEDSQRSYWWNRQGQGMLYGSRGDYTAQNVLRGSRLVRVQDERPCCIVGVLMDRDGSVYRWQWTVVHVTT